MIGKSKTKKMLYLTKAAALLTFSNSQVENSSMTFPNSLLTDANKSEKIKFQMYVKYTVMTRMAN